MKPIITKKHRLPLSAYNGRKKVAFTIVEKERREMFVADYMFAETEKILKEAMRKRNCFGRIYCIGSCLTMRT